MSLGYIKLHRKLLDSWVFSDPKALTLWVWLLLKANHKTKFVSIKTGRGTTVVEVHRGQVLTGRNSIEKETGINARTAYDILKRFQKQHMISLNPNTHYSLINIENYDNYQDFDSEEEGHPNNQTANQPTTNQQPTNTNNNDKNDKNDKNRGAGGSDGAEAPRVGQVKVSKPKKEKPPLFLSKEKIEASIDKLCSYYPLRAGKSMQHSDKVQIKAMVNALNTKPKMIEKWLADYESNRGKPYINAEHAKNPLNFLKFRFDAYRMSIDTGLFVDPVRFNYNEMFLNIYPNE